MARDGLDKYLRANVAILGAFGRAMTKMACKVPDRATLGQTVFFLTVARADLQGNPATFGDFEASVMSRSTASLKNTHKLFLASPRATGACLGWLTTERSLSRTGRVHFRLTPKGREVLADMMREYRPG
jgi:hypothetical protein